MTKRSTPLFLILLIIFTASLSLLDSSPSVPEVTVGEQVILSQTFTSKSILFDESHCAGASDMWTPGNASLFGWLAGYYGYNCSTNWDIPLDSGILDDYEILCLFFPQIPLTQGEVNAVHDFVSSGGSLLLVGTDESTQSWEYTPTNLNPVSEIYGIEFNADSVLGISDKSNGDMIENDLTFSVNSFHSSCDQLRGCSLTIESPAEEIGEIKDNIMLAIAESGNSRIVAIGTPAPFMIYRHGRGWQKDPYDHFQLSLNIIDWIAGNSPREVDIPEYVPIRIGTGPEMEESELDEYIAFNGVYHDHTTYSDGLDSPLDMLAQALYTGLDFYLGADHSYENPANNGIQGAKAVRQLKDLYDLDCPIFIGAELSSLPHTVGFPLTENIFTADIQEAVDGIHDQGGIAVLAHPTIGFPYAVVWEAFDDYGYDAFEVSCRGYFHCMGESCYSRPFIASNDGHSAPLIDLVRTVAYVKDPTGPNGTISVQDLVDAVLDYRIVIIERPNGVILGQGKWVDRFLESVEEAETVVENAQHQLEQLESEGAGLGLSRHYLEDAERFLERMNPKRAIRAANDAISEFVLGLDLDINLSGSGVIEPHSTASMSINFTNTHSYGLEFNITPFVKTSFSFEQSHQIIQAGPESSTLIDFVGTASSFGYTRLELNLKDFNTTNTPSPIIVRLGGIISNISIQAEQEGAETSVTIRLLKRGADTRFISSAQIRYDDGSGMQTVPLDNYGDSYGIVLGPYNTGTNITHQILITDVLGNSFIIDGGTYQIENVPLGPELWLSAIIGIGLVGLLSVVIIIARRRRISES